MFYVQSPMKREFFVEELDGKTLGDVSYKFEKIEGMKIYFSYTGTEDVNEVMNVAKAHLKSTEYGKVLYFRVSE